MTAGMDIDWTPGDGKLRRFGWLAAVAFGALAWSSSSVFTPGLALVAILSAVFSLADPRANRPLYLGVTLATYPIGLVVSYLSLLLVFFGLLTPVAAVLRLLGRDPMASHLDPAARSYWQKARPARPKTSYFRQY